MAAQSFLAIASGKFARIFALQASSGSANAGSVVALNASGQIDLTMAPDPAAFAASLWYAPYREVGTGSGSNPGNGSIRFHPLIIYQRCTIQALAVNVTTLLAAGSVQIAIYASDPTLKKPTGAPLYSSASLGTTLTGTLSTATFSLQLAPGLYWVATNSNNTSVVYTSTVATSMGMAGIVGSASASGAIAGISGLALAQTFGTWPTLSSSTTFTEVATASVPLVTFQVKSVP